MGFTFLKTGRIFPFSSSLKGGTSSPKRKINQRKTIKKKKNTTKNSQS